MNPSILVKPANVDATPALVSLPSQSNAPVALPTVVPLTTPPPALSVPEEFKVETTYSIEAMRGIEPEWQSLSDTASEPNPFYEPWAALPALEAFHPAGDVLFVMIWGLSKNGQGPQLCGLFPLQRRRAAGPLPIQMWGMWRHPYCYLGAPLVRAGMELEVIRAFLDWMGEGGRERGLLRIEDLPGDGPLRHALVSELYFRKWPSAITQTFTRAYFTRAASAEAYLAQNLSGKKRKELRRQANRLGEKGKMELVELGRNEPYGPWADEFVALEARGWKGREGVAVAGQEAHRRYFRELIRHASLRDRLMLLSLRVDGKPIAMKLNMLAKGGSMAFKITYDEDWSDYSPGVQLELENIRKLHERRDIPWMDSCAAPNRWMINQLWSGRREFQTLLVATDDFMGSLVTAAFPILRWAKDRACKLMKRSEASRG